jgi:hypothetical protein
MTENPDRADPALLIPVVEQGCIHANMCTAEPGGFFDGLEKISQRAQLAGFHWLTGEFRATDHHNSEIKDMSVRLKLPKLNN